MRYLEITSAGLKRLADLKRAASSSGISFMNIDGYVLGEFSLLLKAAEDREPVPADNYSARAVYAAIERGRARVLTDREVVLYRLQGKI